MFSMDDISRMGVELAKMKEKGSDPADIAALEEQISQANKAGKFSEDRETVFLAETETIEKSMVEVNIAGEEGEDGDAIKFRTKSAEEMFQRVSQNLRSDNSSESSQSPYSTFVLALSQALGLNESVVVDLVDSTGFRGYLGSDIYRYNFDNIERIDYEPGHPCYTEPLPVPTKRIPGGITPESRLPPPITFPDFQGDHSIPPASERFSRSSSEALPVYQFKEDQVHQASRSKIVVDQQIAYYNYDNWDLAKGLNDVYDSGAETNHKMFGWPGLPNVYNYITRGYNYESGFTGPVDRLRWCLGKVWVYSDNYASDLNDSIDHVPPELGYSRLQDGSLVRTRNMATGEVTTEEYDFHFDVTKEQKFANSPGNGAFIRAIPATNQNDGVILVSENENNSGIQYTEESILISLNNFVFYNDRNFLQDFIAGTGVNQPRNNADFRANGPSQSSVKKLLTKFGALEFAVRPEEVYSVPTAAGSILPEMTFSDTAHKVNMPFFDKEMKQINYSNSLNASIELQVNGVPEVYKNFINTLELPYQNASYDPGTIFDSFGIEMKRGEEHLLLPNVYRLFKKQYQNPDEFCDESNYFDKLLKFTDYNVEHFDEVKRQYGSMMPMSVNIKFNTETGNRFNRLFKKYEMGKYVLDALARIDLSTASRLAYPISDYSYDGEQFFTGKNYYTQFLQQGVSLGPPSADLRPTLRDLNYWTSEDGNTVFNEKLSYKSLIRVHDFETWMNKYITLANIEKFDESVFPLGAHIPTYRHWSNFLAILNKIFFQNEFMQKLWQGYDSGDNRDANQENDAVRKFFRSYSDILRGKLAYSETIAYKVEKYEVGVGYDASTETYTTQGPQQTFIFFDSDDVGVIDFMDTQVLYGKTYKYVIKSINLVIGSSYYYVFDDQQPSDSDYNENSPSFPQRPEGIVSVDGEEQWQNWAGQPENGSDPESDYVIDFLDEAYRVPNNINSNILSDLRERITSFLFDTRPRAYFAQADRKVKLRIISKPKIILSEVPYFTKSLTMLDRPPVAPNVKFFPIHDSKNQFNLILSRGGGSSMHRPEILRPQDEAVIYKMLRAQEADEKGRILHSNDSIPSQYELFTYTAPENMPYMAPTRYTDFDQIRIIDATENGTLFLYENIQANVPVYYMFRSVDSHNGERYGVSPPSIMYCVTLVSGVDGTYLSVKDYSFPIGRPIYGGTFKKCINISPSDLQISKLNQIANRIDNNSKLEDFARVTGFDISGLGSLGQGVLLPDDLLEGALKNKQNNLDTERDKLSIWDNPNFRLRVKSRQTGKTIDIDLKFKSKLVEFNFENLIDVSDRPLPPLACIGPNVPAVLRDPNTPFITADADEPRNIPCSPINPGEPATIPGPPPSPPPQNNPGSTGSRLPTGIDTSVFDVGEPFPWDLSDDLIPVAFGLSEVFNRIKDALDRQLTLDMEAGNQFGVRILNGNPLLMPPEDELPEQLQDQIEELLGDRPGNQGGVGTPDEYEDRRGRLDEVLEATGLSVTGQQEDIFTGLGSSSDGTLEPIREPIAGMGQGELVGAGDDFDFTGVSQGSEFMEAGMEAGMQQAGLEQARQEAREQQARRREEQAASSTNETNRAREIFMNSTRDSTTGRETGGKSGSSSDAVEAVVAAFSGTANSQQARTGVVSDAAAAMVQVANNIERSIVCTGGRRMRHPQMAAMQKFIKNIYNEQTESCEPDCSQFGPNIVYNASSRECEVKRSTGQSTASRITGAMAAAAAAGVGPNRNQDRADNRQAAENRASSCSGFRFVFPPNDNNNKSRVRLKFNTTTRKCEPDCEGTYGAGSYYDENGGGRGEGKCMPNPFSVRNSSAGYQPMGGIGRNWNIGS